MAQHNGKSGWVPAAYLQPCTMIDDEDHHRADDDKSYLGFVVEGKGCVYMWEINRICVVAIVNTAIKLNVVI